MVCICINQAIGIGASKFNKYVVSYVKIFVVGGQNSKEFGNPDVQNDYYLATSCLFWLSL